MLDLQLWEVLASSGEYDVSIRYYTKYQINFDSILNGIEYAILEFF